MIIVRALLQVEGVPGLQLVLRVRGVEMEELVVVVQLRRAVGAVRAAVDMGMPRTSASAVFLGQPRQYGSSSRGCDDSGYEVDERLVNTTGRNIHANTELYAEQEQKVDLPALLAEKDEMLTRYVVATTTASFARHCTFFLDTGLFLLVELDPSAPHPEALTFGIA
jgi:hypothetical protein